MAPKYTAVETIVGVMGWGAIALSSLQFTDVSTASLSGTLDPALCSGLEPNEDSIAFELIFNTVLWFKLSDTDYIGLDDAVDEEQSFDSEILDLGSGSSFEIKEVSNMITRIQSTDYTRRYSSLKYFSVHSHQVAVDLIALGFELKISRAGI